MGHARPPDLCICQWYALVKTFLVSKLVCTCLNTALQQFPVAETKEVSQCSVQQQPAYVQSFKPGHLRMQAGVRTHCLPAATCCTGTTEQDHYIVSANMTCYVAESLPAGGKRKRVQTKLFGDDFVRDDLKPGRGPRRRKVGLLPL